MTADSGNDISCASAASDSVMVIASSVLISLYKTLIAVLTPGSRDEDKTRW